MRTTSKILIKIVDLYEHWDKFNDEIKVKDKNNQINYYSYENKLLNISKIKFNDVNEMCDEYIALYNELID